MPKRIYSPEEYLKGLEAQNIVVYDAMRQMILRMNMHGILEGHPPKEDPNNPLLPPNDVRYEAGHADRLREAQEKLEAFRRIEEHEDNAAREAPVRYLGLASLKGDEQKQPLKPEEGMFVPVPGHGYPAPIGSLGAGGMGQLGFNSTSAITAPALRDPVIVIPIHATRAEIVALIQHHLSTGNGSNGTRVAELAALLV